MSPDPHGAVKETLMETLEWLKSSVPTDLEWTMRTEDVGHCLNLMKSISERTIDSEAVRAIRHLEAMLEAMRARNRRRAFEAGASAYDTL